MKVMKDEKIGETLERSDALVERLRAGDLQTLPCLIEAMTGAKVVNRRRPVSAALRADLATL